MKRGKANKRTITNALNIDLLKIDFRSKYLRLLNSARLLKIRKEELQLAFADVEDIYNNAPYGYHSLDDKGFFVRINNTVLRWLGETRESFTGVKKFTDILTEERITKFKKSYPEFMKTGYIQDAEFDFVRSDGS